MPIPTLPRKYYGVVAIALSLALLAYALLGSSDEDKIVARLKELAAAVEPQEGENVLFRTARLKKLFGQALEPNASISAPELPTTTGRDELLALAVGAQRFSNQFRINLGATDVRIDGDDARAVSAVTLMGVEGSELHGDRRSVRFRLRKDGGEWRVGSIEVEAKSEEEPEARP